MSRDKQADLIPPGVFDARRTQNWATDPESSRQNPPMLVRRTAVCRGQRELLERGQGPVRPGRLPGRPFCFMRMGCRPSEHCAGLFRAVNRITPYKRLIELSEGTIR